MKILIVGLGEVGSALYSIACENKNCSVYGYDIDPLKTVNSLDEIPKTIDYLHIAIPYTSMEKFINATKSYIDKFNPKTIFIHSTVAPGTTRKIYETLKIPIAYTPILGKHPNLKRHLLFWPKWITAIPKEKIEEAAKHLEELGFKVRKCNCNPESLELAKIWETVYRAAMIASWQEIHRIARKVNADIKVIAEFIGMVHEVLEDRPIYYPNVIGGHCLIPNTKILKTVYPSKLLEFIIESNEKRREEIKNQEIKNEIEELKQIATKYFNKKYYEKAI